MRNQLINFCKLIKNTIRMEEDVLPSNDIAWQRLVQIAREQNLLAVFVEEAVNYPSYTSRSEYMKEMSEAVTIVAMQTRKTNAFLELYEAFLATDLHPLVMKGLICRQLYGKLCDHRPSGDEDVLIRLCEYEKTKDILIANGYVPQIEVTSEKQLENLQEVSFIHPIKKLHIELHLNVMGRENDARSKMSDCFKNVFEDYREVEIEGIKIRTLSHQNHLLYLILHAFKHFISGGFGIRQMLDILLYQEQFGQEIDFERLENMLRVFKADKFWVDLISIGNKYFGFHLPVSQSQNCPEELLEDMLFCGAFGNGTQALRAAGRTTLFATGDYLKNKQTNQFILFWRAIFPNKVYLLPNAPQLETRPWLLPVEWVKRWGRFIKRSFGYEGGLANESIEISRKRMKLLKKYDLL